MTTSVPPTSVSFSKTTSNLSGDPLSLISSSSVPTPLCHQGLDTMDQASTDSGTRDLFALPSFITSGPHDFDGREMKLSPGEQVPLGVHSPPVLSLSEAEKGTTPGFWRRGPPDANLPGGDCKDLCVRHQRMANGGTSFMLQKVCSPLFSFSPLCD